MLQSTDIVVVRPSNWAVGGFTGGEAFPVNDEVDSKNTQIWTKKEKQRKLEDKVENVLCKINMMIVCVVCIVLGCVVLMYCARK